MNADLDQTTFAGGFRVATCPNCGLAHDAACRFCRACGHALTNVAPPLPSIAPPPLPSVAAPAWSTPTAPAASGPSGFFPLAASTPTVQPTSAPPPAKHASSGHALLIALSVAAGLPVAQLIFWIGLGGATWAVFDDRRMVTLSAWVVSAVFGLALLVWFGRASWRWLLAGILCAPVALPVYIYKERRGAISRRTGRPLTRFPGLAVNASLIGAGVLALIVAGAVAVMNDKGSSTHDVVVAQTAPSGTLGRYALSCACDDTGTQHFDVIVNTAGVSSRIGSARAGGEFVVITLKITNTGTQPSIFPFRSTYGLVDGDGNHFDAIRLTDRAGRTFTQDYDATEEFWYMNPSARWPSDRLQPGIAYSFGLVFDVPVDDPGLVVNIGATTTLTLPELKPAATDDAL